MDPVLTQDIRTTRPIIIALDFDGPCHFSRKGWHDGTIYDHPTFGLRDNLRSLLKRGYKVVIYSCRSTAREVAGQQVPSQLEQMQAWWKKYDLPEVEWYEGGGKPLAHVYVDDNAVFFQNWAQAVSDVTKRYPS